MRAVLPTALLLAALAAATPAAAQSPTPTPTPAPTVTPAPTAVPEPLIAAGVTSGGVDLSGLTITQAEAALNAAMAKPAKAPVQVRVAKRTFTLGTKKVKLAFDANRTARRAFHAGQDTPPAAGTQLDVPLAIEFIRTPIRRFVDRIARQVDIAPQDATVRITVRHIFRRKSASGRALPVKKVNAAIERTLADPRVTRLIRPTRTWVKPKVRWADLPKRYPTIVTVDKSTFTARLFKNLKYSRRYTVAIGQPAYPTPEGLFSVSSMQVNPTWTVPNSPWAGELQGQSVSASDPNNPLKARWIGIVNGVGFHGTGQDYSVGTAASHGCLRMHVPDVIDLYSRVSIGTPVLIAA